MTQKRGRVNYITVEVDLGSNAYYGGFGSQNHPIWTQNFSEQGPFGLLGSNTQTVFFSGLSNAYLKVENLNAYLKLYPRPFPAPVPMVNRPPLEHIDHPSLIDIPVVDRPPENPNLGRRAEVMGHGIQCTTYLYHLFDQIFGGSESEKSPVYSLDISNRYFWYHKLPQYL